MNTKTRKDETMTETQKLAVQMMDRNLIGAMVTKFGWTWPETCRKNEDAAKEVVRILGHQETQFGCC